MGLQMSLSKPNQPDVLDLLTPQQIVSLPPLAAGELAKDVAVRIGVSPQTVSQWINHDQNFRHALWSIRKATLDSARAQLQLAATEAVGVIRNLLHQGKSEQTRLKAAQLLLDRLGLVGRYSDSGFDGPVISPAIDYAPLTSQEISANQTEEAVKLALGAIARLKERVRTGTVCFNSTPPETGG